ncbi:MAG TPA: GatB/YqeY domain-containing protein [Syntrophorhabdaceae bacterium]|nr:GatB/YqeY domain-containing protein [Syntrophorhabdaceae bacterium]HQM80473.1 GatB/YqeY domain-containing protein [Syntrophorhabdaceae bacterium]
MEQRLKIEERLKEALKQKDSLRVSVLRMLLAAIKNKEVEKIRALTEDEFFAIVKTSIKQHLDSIEGFTKGQRLDLVEKEEKELQILKEFLPAQLTEEEVAAGIDEAINAVEAKGQKDMGKVIKFLMEKYPGRVDGKVLSAMVLKRLSSR